MQPLKPKLLVMADDLTGALDVGAEFGKRNVATLVNLDKDADWRKIWSRCDVLAVDTESRHVTTSEAARRVAWCVEQGRDTGATHFFKKTDSTLRGNIGSELSALAKQTDRTVWYVPAAPLYGRTTRGGFQYVGERLLHETEFAHDPLEPITTSHVPALLEKQSSVPVRWLASEDLGQRVRDGIAEPSITVLDATTEDHVAAIIKTLRTQSMLHVLGGTARFASHLADALALPPSPKMPLKPSGPILVINGSANARALEQVRWAIERKLFFEVRLPPQLLIAADGYKSALSDLLIAELDRVGRCDVLLHSITHREELDSYRHAASSSAADDVHFAAAENLAQFVARILARRRFEFIVVFGGDTLCALAKTLGWRGLCPRTEVVPGVAVSNVLGLEHLVVATKPGGFGPVDVLQRIKEFVS